MHKVGAVLTPFRSGFLVVQEVFFGGGSHGLDVVP